MVDSKQGRCFSALLDDTEVNLSLCSTFPADGVFKKSAHFPQQFFKGSEALFSCGGGKRTLCGHSFAHNYSSQHHRPGTGTPTPFLSSHLSQLCYFTKRTCTLENVYFSFLKKHKNMGRWIPMPSTGMHVLNMELTEKNEGNSS